MSDDPVFRPLIRWEDLFRPIEPPRQPDVKLPSRDDLCREIRRAGTLLNNMAEFVEIAPFADDCFDTLDAQAADALRAAQQALATFRATRDARGSA